MTGEELLGGVMVVVFSTTVVGEALSWRDTLLKSSVTSVTFMTAVPLMMIEGKLVDSKRCR
jgi:hypothetical protein